MSYHIVMEIREDYLRVEVSGHRDPGDEVARSLESWRKVANICREHDIRAVLTILNLSGRLPILAAYNIGTSLSETGLPKSTRFAVVDMNEDSREGNLFSETVATNRGYVGRVFANEDAALAWLLGEK